MGNFRQKIGEVSNRNVINLGDTIIVTFFENGVQTTINGILINISSGFMEINGTTPRRQIPIHDISIIQKI